MGPEVAKCNFQRMVPHCFTPGVIFAAICSVWLELRMRCEVTNTLWAGEYV